MKSNLRFISTLSKTLALYFKCGNLSGVLGLLISIRWCFYILIDLRRLPKCLTRVALGLSLKGHLTIPFHLIRLIHLNLPGTFLFWFLTWLFELDTLSVVYLEFVRLDTSEDSDPRHDFKGAWHSIFAHAKNCHF